MGPEALQFSVGGLMGRSFEFGLDSGQLVYRTFSHGHWPMAEARLNVAEREWQAFHDRLDELDLHHWLEHYHSPLVDGTQWSLSLRFDDLVAESSGSNAYPGRPPSETSGPSYSPAFVALLRAFAELLDGLAFVELPSHT